MTDTSRPRAESLKVLSSSVPQIFGSRTRTHYLVSLYFDGPGHIAEIARRLQIERGHATVLTRHFADCGIIALPLQRYARVAFDPDSALSIAVQRFLAAALKGRVLRSTVVRARSAGKTKNQRCLESVFGSPNRTAILSAVEKYGPISLVDVAGVTSIRHGSVRDAVAHFVDQGVFRCTRVAPHVYVDIDQRFRAVDDLRALIRVVAEAFPPLNPPPASRIKAPTTAAPQDPVQYVPIGTRTQAQLLLALSRVGSIRVSDLAPIVDMTQDAVRGIAHSLIASGFVVCEAKRGGRNKERWLSLNAAHCLYRTLRRMLEAIVRDYPLIREMQGCLRNAGIQLPGRAIAETTHYLPGSDRCIDVLAHLNGGPAYASEIAASLQLPLVRVRKHLAALESICVVRRDAISRRVSLDPRFPYAGELADFLRAVEAARFRSSRDVHLPGAAHDP